MTDLIDTLRRVTLRLTDLWGVQPVWTLACIGGSDEHWQAWHPADRVSDGMPSLLVLPSSSTELHPDGRQPRV